MLTYTHSIRQILTIVIAAIFFAAFSGSMAVAQPTKSAAPLKASATTRESKPGYKVYDHTVSPTPPAKGDHLFRLVVPEGLEVVRGILMVGPYSGGDSRDYHKQVWYREFLNRHGFVFLGAKNFYLHDYKIFQDAIEQLAKQSRHPELVNAPFAATGFSAGGGFTRRLMWEAPDRLIAGVVVGSTMKLPGPFTENHLGVPMCIINGEFERAPGEAGGMANALEPVLAANRPRGALWGWMAVQGVGHEFAGQEVLAMPMLDAAVRMRYPENADVRKGPVKLKPVELASGWIADNASWKSGLTAVTPAAKFQGDLAKSSWLLNEDIAFIYRAYSSQDWRLKITSPDRMSAKHELQKVGSSLRIQLDDSRFPGWKKLELYDGSRKVAELTQGPAHFTVPDLKAGYHAFSVLGTDANDQIWPSNPVLIVVR